MYAHAPLFSAISVIKLGLSYDKQTSVPRNYQISDLEAKRYQEETLVDRGDTETNTGQAVYAYTHAGAPNDRSVKIGADMNLTEINWYINANFFDLYINDELIQRLGVVTGQSSGKITVPNWLLREGTVIRINRISGDTVILSLIGYAV